MADPQRPARSREPPFSGPGLLFGEFVPGSDAWGYGGQEESDEAPNSPTPLPTNRAKYETFAFKPLPKTPRPKKDKDSDEMTMVRGRQMRPAVPLVSHSNVKNRAATDPVSSSFQETGVTHDP